MNATETRAVTCPKCRTQNNIPVGFEGAFRCARCKAVIRVGGAAQNAAQKKNTAARDAGDSRTAQRALIGFLIFGVILAAVILNQKPPPPPPAPKPAPPAAVSSGTIVYDPPPVKRDIPKRSRPLATAKDFLKAMAEDDGAKIDALFDYERYYAGIARRLQWEDARKYENQTPEQKTVMREEAKGFLTSSPERSRHLKDFAVPKLAAWPDEQLITDTGQDYESFQFDVRNETGKTAFMLKIVVALRAGFDPVTDAENAKAWFVSEVGEQWMTTTVGRNRKDSRMKDAIEDRKKEETIATKTRGPVEEAPVELPPMPGTSDGQAATFKSAIAALIDPSTGAKDLRKARETLRDGGKPAIPFLLNALVGKDHRENEAHRTASGIVVRELIEITGVQIPYGPMNNDQAAFGGMLQMTPDEREQSVRRWFGWWKTKGPKFTKKLEAPEPDDDAAPPTAPGKAPKKP